MCLVFFYTYLTFIPHFKNRGNKQADQNILRSARKVRLQSPVQFQLCHPTHQLFQEGIPGRLQRGTRYKAQVPR